MCFHLVYICFKQWHNLAFILIGHVGGSCDEDIQIQIYHYAIGSRIQQRDIKIHYIIMSSGQDSAEDSVLATFAEGIPAIVTAWTSSHWYSTQIHISTNVSYQRMPKSMLSEPVDMHASKAC